MRYIKAYRAYFLLCLVGVGLYAVHCVLARAVYCMDECSIDIEGCPSEGMRQDVVAYLAHQWPILYSSANQLCKQTMQRFAWIQSIDILRMPYGKTRVDIVAYTPLYVVNNEYVVTNVGSLLKKENFAFSIVNNLRSFAIVLSPGITTLSDVCKRFVATAVPSLFDRYICTCENDNMVRLKDKKSVFFTIIFHPDAIPSDALIRDCNAIKQEIMGRSVFKSQRQKSWIADIRFEGQIVVSQEHRGGAYGANV